MKRKFGIATSTVFALLLSANFLAAQYHDDFGRSCEYDDRVVIINDYGNDYDTNYRGKRKRNSKRIRQERRWKAKILQRAYAIAEADGRVTRRERREIRKLEQDLGIYRKGRGHNHNRDREYRGHY